MFIDNNKIKLNGLLNISASFVYLIIICVYYFLISQSKKDKFLFYILFFFNFFTLILLARRSPLLGIFSGTLLSMLFYRYFNRKLFIISLSILITIFSITFHPDLKNTILVRGDTSENILKFKEKEVNNLSSVGFRLYEWERSVSILKENPFVGSGLGRKIMKERFFSESLIGHPHNTLISLALQSGIQTVITFLLFYFILFIKNLNLRKSPIKEIYYFSLLSFIFMISMFWIFMFAGVEEKIGFIPFWMMSGANLGVIIFSRDRYHKA
jgi:O-antigen ligase